jgi:Holliday junction DNA helicase RuvB
VLLAQGARTRTVRVVLAPFTLVGATTEPEALAEPFRARFRLQERLQFYGEAEIAAVVERAAPQLGAGASPEACAEIARRARGIPREALRLLERARDVMQVAAGAAIVPEHVLDAAARLGIDAEGLSLEERRIAQVLVERGRPMGIEAIAATLRLPSRTVRQVFEPYLVARGYLVRSSRGREATLKARGRFGGGGAIGAAALAS